MSQFKVVLADHPTAVPYEMIQFLASLCYQPSLETAREVCAAIPVRDGLFKPGHHTPMESGMYTFTLDKVPVSSITFGLHMTHGFYNSTQRSGRYCTDMFKGGTDELLEYSRSFMEEYTPSIMSADRDHILNFVNDGVHLYERFHPIALDRVNEVMFQERPKASPVITANASRYAQEQTRNFLSTIQPTALGHSMDLIALASMFQSAWNTPLKDLLGDMVKEVIEWEPRLAFMGHRYFDQPWIPQTDFIDWECTASLAKGPRVHSVSCMEGKQQLDSTDIVFSDFHQPLDLLHFHPEVSRFNDTTISVEQTTTVATLGQSQRHRAMGHTPPTITHNFYLPPLLQHSEEAKKAARAHYQQWINLSLSYGIGNLIHFIPYGAMVKYTRSGRLPGFLHDMSRRLCFCAQEEIYEVSRRVSNQMSGHLQFSAPCKVGKKVCSEGRRMCGRAASAGGENNPVRIF